MQIPVIVELISGDLFRAQACPFPGLAAEGKTREEAVEKLQRQLKDNLASGSKNIVIVDVPVAQADSWQAFAGSIPDDELMSRWRGAVEEFRRQRDLEDGIG